MAHIYMCQIQHQINDYLIQYPPGIKYGMITLKENVNCRQGF